LYISNILVSLQQNARYKEKNKILLFSILLKNIFKYCQVFYFEEK